MVSPDPLISKSPRPSTNPLVTVRNTPITIGIIVTFRFQNFFCSLARSKYLSLFSLSFNCTMWSGGTAKSTIRRVIFFLLLTITRSSHLAEITWSVCISKSQLPSRVTPLQRGNPTNECPCYDTKQSDGEVPAMLELWGIRSTPLLPSLPGPLWPGVVAPDGALSMG